MRIEPQRERTAETGRDRQPVLRPANALRRVVPSDVEEIDGCDEVALKDDRQIDDRAASERGDERVVGKDRGDIFDGVRNEGSPLAMDDVEPARRDGWAWCPRPDIPLGGCCKRVGQGRRSYRRHDCEEPVADRRPCQVLKGPPARPGLSGLRNRVNEFGFTRTTCSAACPRLKRALTLDHFHAQAKPDSARHAVDRVLGGVQSVAATPGGQRADLRRSATIRAGTLRGNIRSRSGAPDSVTSGAKARMSGGSTSPLLPIPRHAQPRERNDRRRRRT